MQSNWRKRENIFKTQCTIPKILAIKLKLDEKDKT